jgi:hypothetical protein
MAAHALLKFVQGSNVGEDGQALLGVPGTSVALSNVDNTDVASWQIDLVWSDPESGIPAAIPFAFNNNSSTPAANFTPDVKSSFRFVLKVWDVPNRTGDPSDVDIRNFSVPDGDYIVPPAQVWPLPLPDPRSGQAGAKPNEMNFGGQPDGWAGNSRRDGLASDFLRRRGGIGLLVTAVKSVDVDGTTLSDVTVDGDVSTNNTNGAISIGSFGADWRNGEVYLPNVVVSPRTVPTILRILDVGSGSTPFKVQDTGVSPTVLIAEDPGLDSRLWEYPKTTPGPYSPLASAAGGGLVATSSIASPISPLGDPAVWHELEETAGSTECAVGASSPGDSWIVTLNLDAGKSDTPDLYAFRIVHTIDGGSDEVAPGSTSTPITLEGTLSFPPITVINVITGVTADALVFRPQFQGGPTDSTPMTVFRLRMTVVKG